MSTTEPKNVCADSFVLHTYVKPARSYPYSENEILMTQRRLRELSTVIFISNYTSRFHAIRQVVPRCSVLYDRLYVRRMFTAKHNRSQPD